VSGASTRRGPLTGIRVVEIGGIGPGPHAAMLLGDLGADVVRVERGGPVPGDPMPDHSALATTTNPILRSRRLVTADLKDPADRAAVRDLIAFADVLLEGFRPGVMERLELGPESFDEINPGLVYARLTGWGQTGPLAQSAGHDINYLSLTGALDAIGLAGGPPTVPLNLVGDFGGGSVYAVLGVLAALLERAGSGRGQVVDAAIVDGVGSLMQMFWAWRSVEAWQPNRGSNLLDGGAPFYTTYQCADGGHVAVGAIEPAFYAALLRGLDLSEAAIPDRADRAMWPALRGTFADAFAARTRDQWVAVFADLDACVTPVLTAAEVADHPHVVARAGLLTGSGTAAAVAPRLTRTGGAAFDATRTNLANAVDRWLPASRSVPATPTDSERRTPR